VSNGVVAPLKEPSHGLPYSVDLTLPPLGVLWLTPREGGTEPAAG
jgi:hypothetical protein